MQNNDDSRKGSEQAGVSSPILGIDHVAIAVEELSEGIRWFCGALGMKLVQKRLTQGAHTSMLSAVLQGGGITIVLVQGTTPRSQVSQFIRRFGPGVQHLAINVDSLDRTMELVRTVGCEAEIPVISGDGIRQLFLRREPGSGVRIELIERQGGDFTDASVEALFREFEIRELV